MEHFDLTSAIIFGIATLQGLLVGFTLVFQRKGAGLANVFLTALTFCITLIIFQNFIVFSGAYKQVPHLIFPFYSLNGLKAPLFLFYVLYLLYPKRKFRWYDLLHGVVFLYMLYEQSGFLSLKAEYKSLTADYLYYGEGKLNTFSLYHVLVFRLIPVVYALYALRLIKSRLASLKSWSSDTNIQYLSRFQWTVRIALGIFIAFFLMSVYSYAFKLPIGQYEIYHHLLNSLIVLAIAIVAMQQPDRLLFSLTAKTKNTSTKASHELAISSLKQLMHDSKPYLNPQLKLYDLAQLAKTQPHVLSDQINQEMKMNFYEFVNQYRVSEFKERVVNPEYGHLTLLAIALDVGFNSKASFNRIFKKQTGMTPSQYKATLAQAAE